jgi:hypothetical protein
VPDQVCAACCQQFGLGRPHSSCKAAAAVHHCRLLVVLEVLILFLLLLLLTGCGWP